MLGKLTQNLILLGVVGFATCATGVLSVSHDHDHDGDHASPSCAVCVHLSLGGKAPLGSANPLADFGVSLLGYSCSGASDEPVAVFAPASIIPRGPPAAV